MSGKKILQAETEEKCLSECPKIAFLRFKKLFFMAPDAHGLLCEHQQLNNTSLQLTPTNNKAHWQKQFTSALAILLLLLSL